MKIDKIRYSIAGKDPKTRQSVSRRKMQGEYRMNCELVDKREGFQINEAKQIVNALEKQFQQNDKIIQQNLNDQDSQLLLRIAQKKARINMQKKKAQPVRANSYDQDEMNKAAEAEQEEEDKIQAALLQENTGIQVLDDEQDDNQFNETNKSGENCASSLKKNQIQNLRQSFNQSYNNMCTSLSMKRKNSNYGNLYMSRKVSSSKVDERVSIIQEGDESETRNTVSDRKTEASNKDDLDTFISQRITLRNPYEEEDDD